MTSITELRVRRDDLTRTEAATREVVLGEDNILCRVDRFALTANNITYAAHGDDMNYWQFFPAPGGWGIVPVWGFAEVVESRCDGVAVGARFYGYWPMASHAVCTPVKVTPRGFVDGAAHRDGLAAVYNAYQLVDAGVGDERTYALFRPLYLTSFLLAEVYGGDDVRIILSSASSKTALGMAQGLRQRQRGRTVVGLTSARNAAFVAATGFYTDVVTYDALESIAVAPTIYVDFAGDRALRRAVHARFDTALLKSVVVGDTHIGTPDGDGAMAGVRPDFFFAPTHLAERRHDTAPGGFLDRFNVGWDSFVAATAPWLRYVESSGATAVSTHFANFVSGRVDPAQGVILRP